MIRIIGLRVWKRIGLILPCLSLMLSFPDSALSGEIYKFDRMWPTLQQPWYFSGPTGLAVDSSGHVYVADSSNDRIQKLTKDGHLITKWGNHLNMRYPRGLAIDIDGNLFVVDHLNHRIRKFTSQGQLLATWGSPGSGDGEFKEPADIAIGISGDVYVADTANHRIQKFTPEGQFIAKWGSKGNGDGEFQFVEIGWMYGVLGLAADTSGNIYVADSGNHRIQKFTSEGQFIAKWGSEGEGDGQFSQPAGIAFDDRNHVYVADTQNYRIQKFSASGQFIGKWGKRGGGDGEFSAVAGIATDSNGDLHISDTHNHNIQKFTSEGIFLSRWNTAGNDEGYFNRPTDIAADGSGNIYVADYDNGRVQKFDPDGQFAGIFAGVYAWGIAVDTSGDVYVSDNPQDRILKFDSEGQLMATWGGPGNNDGEFNSPQSIAIDSSGNVYVSDTRNNRIQKFTGNGEFLKKWGTPGSENGQFGYAGYGPYGITVDNNGKVYVADPHNNRIQIFTSDGSFIAKWDDYGPADGQLSYPWGIEIGGDGYIYVADTGNHRVQKFTSDGVFVATCGSYGDSPGQMNYPTAVAAGGSGLLYVADTYNQRIQRFKSIALESNNKAIIVAGGGAFTGNNLWDATQMCANFAYRTLTYQGFTKETITYLSSDTGLDLDNNGVADDVDADAANANLQQAITTWARDADSLVLYLADHGGGGTFRMSGTETLSAADLDSWLDSLQSATSCKVIVIYDACESGSFISSLMPPSGKERVVATSTSPGESAKFVTQGSVSFSNYFWTHIFNGVSLQDSLVLARNALSVSFDDQTPLLDANGNGTGNETEDYTLTRNTYIGNGTVISGDAPRIGSVSPAQTISGASSAALYAESVTDSDGIARVWAVIRSPDYNQGASDNPVTSLPSIDLIPVGDDRYEGTWDGFNVAGMYQVAIYARDRIGNTSIPRLTSVSVNNPLRRKAVIVAGGPSSDVLWPAIQNNAGIAWEALTFQGYTHDDIYFMSPETFSPGVDGLPTLSNLEYAIQTWAKVSAQDVVVYLVGNGGNQTFKMNATEDLSAADLDSWLDSLQASISGKVTLIYEACRSGSFLPLLTPPAGKERILMSSASDAESAYFLSGGDISFSKFFWSQVANGSNVRNAFLHGKDAIKFACKGQTPQMDDNGNGTGNEKADGVLARTYTIGFGIMLAGDDPIIGSVSPAQTLSGEKSATLWAKDVTSTNTISKVWAVITPPDYSTDPSSPVTDLATASLTLVGEGRYEGAYSGFSSIGTYAVAIHAMDQDGNVSPGMETTVSQTAALEGCPGCGGEDVTIANKVFDSSTNCECRANKSITIGNGVTIKAGATMIFIAPKVNLKSVFKAEPGATVRIKQE